MPTNPKLSPPRLSAYSQSAPPAPSNLGPGRPRVLDDTKIRHILNVIARGCTLDEAARYVGCAASTIRREARRNPKFGDELRRVLVDAEMSALDTVREAAQRHWRAGRFLLERVAAQRIREKNRRPLNPGQLRRFKNAIAGALESEICDPEMRQRLTERLKQVVHDINRHPRALPPKPLQPATSASVAADNPKSGMAPAQNPSQAVN